MSATEDYSRTVHVVLPDQSLTLQEPDESGGSGYWSLRDFFDAKNPEMGVRCAGGFY
ncbi:MAG TPA: hypothetical protein VGP37_12380 [Candidatus Nanopelagicales bacterium]|nr:hypothetical protein [Candidatus Nanopelagicales bacterium]